MTKTGIWKAQLKFRLQNAYQAMLERVHGIYFLKHQLPKYHRQTPLFEHINIQTNHRCTRQCDFCYFGLDLDFDPLSMPEALFQKAIQDLVDIRFKGRVSLYQINEPLTDKRLRGWLQYTREHLPEVFLFIATNGDLLTKRSASALFASGLDVLHLNSYDRAAYRKNNRLAIYLNRQGFRVVHIPQLDNRLWSSRAGHLKKYHQGPVRAPCELLYKQMVVKPDGTVCSCCNDFFNQNQMGHLKNDSLHDIWFGDPFAKLRKALYDSRREVSPLCGQCDYKGYGGYIRKKNRPRK